MYIIKPARMYMYHGQTCYNIYYCSYRSSHTITTVDCHPQKLCIATGNTLGEIQLWYVKHGTSYC